MKKYLEAVSALHQHVNSLCLEFLSQKIETLLYRDLRAVTVLTNRTVAQDIERLCWINIKIWTL